MSPYHVDCYSRRLRKNDGRRAADIDILITKQSITTHGAYVAIFHSLSAIHIVHSFVKRYHLYIIKYMSSFSSSSCLSFILSRAAQQQHRSQAATQPLQSQLHLAETCSQPSPPVYAFPQSQGLVQGRKLPVSLPADAP